MIFLDSDKNSPNPSKAWRETDCEKNVVEKLPLDTPLFPNKVRFVCISDTHNATKNLILPKADVLIHAGDFLKHSSVGELETFSTFLASLTHIKHKIVIAGNHDKYFDPNFSDIERVQLTINKYLSKNCIYLMDNYVELYGLKIYGSPWQPVHCENAFQLERGQELLEKWNKIPNDTSILITHGPPLGFGDRVGMVKHVGCVDLLNTVRFRVKPKYHIFGHIHEDYGIWTNGVTTFINASICNKFYQPVREPIIFDIDLPDNKTKKDFYSSINNK